MIKIEKYAEMDAIITAFDQGHLGLVVLTSAPGLGKTNAGQGLTSTHRISGHLTPLKLYILLHENRTKNIWIDDIHRLTADRDMRNLLVQLCETTPEKTISWLSSKPLPDGTPETFTTRSHVLITANAIPTIDASKDALASRAHIIQFRPPHAERIARLRQWATHTDIVDHLAAMTDRPVTLRDYAKALEWKDAGHDWKARLDQDHDRLTSADIIEHLKNIKPTRGENERQPWQKLGVSRAKYYRLKKLAKVSRKTSMRLSQTPENGRSERYSGKKAGIVSISRM